MAQRFAGGGGCHRGGGGEGGESRMIDQGGAGDDEDDSIQVLLCGTSNEGTISDFVREHQLHLPPVVGTSPSSSSTFGGGGLISHEGEGLPRGELQQRLDTGGGDIDAYSRTTSMMDYQQPGGDQERRDDGSFADTGREGGGADPAAVNNNIDGILFDYYEETDARGRAKPGRSEGSSGAFLGEAVSPASQGDLHDKVTKPRQDTGGTGGGGGGNGGLDVAACTAQKKVVMEWEMTRDRKWVYARDRSQWFNYGFDEATFKEWIQQQLDQRIERLAHRSVLVPQSGDGEDLTSASGGLLPSRSHLLYNS